jgi:hypothetical protein
VTIKVPLKPLLLAAPLAVLALAGCRKPLLSPQDERSPYDRYDAIRNQSADQYYYDEYGRRRPNIRERLLPKE